MIRIPKHFFKLRGRDDRGYDNINISQYPDLIPHFENFIKNESNDQTTLRKIFITSLESENFYRIKKLLEKGFYFHCKISLPSNLILLLSDCYLIKTCHQN